MQQSNHPSQSNIQTIYRYENRKFYCKTKSKYLNRKDILELVTQQKNFQVIDYTNNQDITNKTLVSLLAELSWSPNEIKNIIINKKQNQ